MKCLLYIRLCSRRMEIIIEQGKEKCQFSMSTHSSGGDRKGTIKWLHKDHFA